MPFHTRHYVIPNGVLMKDLLGGRDARGLDGSVGSLVGPALNWSAADGVAEEGPWFSGAADAATDPVGISDGETGLSGELTAGLAGGISCLLLLKVLSGSAKDGREGGPRKPWFTTGGLPELPAGVNGPTLTTEVKDGVLCPNPGVSSTTH